MGEYTSIEDVKKLFDNLMPWDKVKFACDIQKYSDCSEEEEWLEINEILENNNYTLKDVLDTYPTIKDVIDDLGGVDTVLDWIDEKDIIKFKRTVDLLDEMDEDDIVDYVLENEKLREKIIEG